MATIQEQRIPKRYYMWAFIKSVFQITISVVSISHIIDSSFFFNHQGDVWSKSTILSVAIPQALFEVGDLTFEIWALKREKSRAHLPWDSIAHHSATALYFMYISYMGEELDSTFLSLAMAALSCQVVGPCYTMHRLRIPFPHLPLLTLLVQLCYRFPLALVSVYRAAQHFDVCPLPHFFISLTLAYLDYKWTWWSLKNHRRSRERRRAEKAKQAVRGEKEDTVIPNLAYQALKSL